MELRADVVPKTAGETDVVELFIIHSFSTARVVCCCGVQRSSSEPPVEHGLMLSHYYSLGCTSNTFRCFASKLTLEMKRWMETVLDGEKQHNFFLEHSSAL